MKLVPVIEVASIGSVKDTTTARFAAKLVVGPGLVVRGAVAVTLGRVVSEVVVKRHT